MDRFEMLAGACETDTNSSVKYIALRHLPIAAGLGVIHEGIINGG